VGVDAEGLVVHQLPPQARVILRDAVPSISPGRRHVGCEGAVSFWILLRHAGQVIVEDDYDGEFRFGDRPLDALQTLDRAASVFYVGTFSKSLPARRASRLVAEARKLGVRIHALGVTTHAVRSSAACCSVMAR